MQPVPREQGTGRQTLRTKSRRGCRACKTRKVKCDEQHPACRNCIRRGAICDFLQRPLVPASISTPASLDLELLHHWTISTSSTLSFEPRIRELWKVLVPQIGFTTRYILDGILAFSALHICRFNPRRRDELMSQAMQYHNASLEKALPLLSTVNTENCSELFLFGILALFFNLASPKKDDDILVVGNGVTPEWLYLLRGTEALICAQESALRASNVSLIFRASDDMVNLLQNPPPGETPGISILESAIMAYTKHDLPKQTLLLEVIDRLKRSYALLNRKGFSDTDRMIGFIDWLFDLSDGYFKLLRDGDSEALCVLAYFTVLMKQLELYWWAEGWAIHLIRRIYMVLDTEHRLTIRWPIEEIGWVPDVN